MLDFLTDFELYRDDNSTGLHSSYDYKHRLPFERIDDPIKRTRYFQKVWYHSFTVSFIYIVLVKIGQQIMKDRPPLELRIPLIIWNGFLSVANICIFLRFSQDFIHSLWHEGLYMSICYSVNPNGVAAFWACVYAFTKGTEMGDTFFIVLRKRPLIFLHYYHHAISFVNTMHAGAEHSGPGRSFIFMNCFAHCLMYPYYTCAAYGRRLPRYIAMFVTSIQIVQMVLGVVVLIYVYRIKTATNLPCQMSMSNFYLAVVMYVTFAVLFTDFFVKAYIVKRRKAKKVD